MEIINKRYMNHQTSLFSAAKKVLLGCIIVLLAAPVSAQVWRTRRSGIAEGDNYHFAYISGSVGYSMLQTIAPNTVTMGQLGGAAGLGYEFRNSGLWANVGVQFSLHRSRIELDPYTTDHPGKFNQSTGKTLDGTFHYDFNQVDEIEWNFFDVPVLIGYYTHGFHIGAGVKLSYAINPLTRSHGTYALSFSPELYAATYKDMEERGLKTYEFDSKQQNRLNIGAGLIGEIGYDLLSSMPTNSSLCHVLKLSFYFEYGLNNLNRGDNKQTFELPAPNENGEAAANAVTINPYLNTVNCYIPETEKPYRLVPFFAGAKLTYMIGGSRTARAGFHHGCMCYN